MIKIVGGTYRSRIILTPNEGTVPTKSMVREAIFSALSDIIPASSCLDLFAGSGALGIEALSRGAKQTVFVDSEPAAYLVIEKNLMTLKETKGIIIKADYLAALAKLASEKKVFDVIFLDPPYAMKDSYQETVNFVLSHRMLSPNGAVVLEYEGTIPFEESPFLLARHYNYGRTNVLIVRRPK